MVTIPAINGFQRDAATGVDAIPGAGRFAGEDGAGGSASGLRCRSGAGSAFAASSSLTRASGSAASDIATGGATGGAGAGSRFSKRVAVLRSSARRSFSGFSGAISRRWSTASKVCSEHSAWLSDARSSGVRFRVRITCRSRLLRVRKISVRAGSACGHRFLPWWASSVSSSDSPSLIPARPSSRARASVYQATVCRSAP